MNSKIYVITWEHGRKFHSLILQSKHVGCVYHTKGTDQM